MVSVKRTKQMLTAIIALLLISSFLLKVSAGIGAPTAAIDTVMSGLQMDYTGLSFLAADSWQVGIAKVLDAFILPLLAILIATVFVSALAGFDIKEKLSQSKIRGMKRHAILVPFNSYSELLSKELSRQGISSVVMAKTKKGLARATEMGLIGVIGDIDEPETFEAAGIDRAEFVIACDNDDMKNAITSITARSRSRGVKVISVVNDSENQDKMASLKVDAFVAPEIAAASDIADSIVKNAVVRQMPKES